MSGIIHSLRSLFGSPSADETRSRTRDNGGGDEDDDVFSAFGNDDENETQPHDGDVNNDTQPQHEGGQREDGIGDDITGGNDNDDNGAHHGHGESLTSSGYTTAAGQSLATQMTTTPARTAGGGDTNAYDKHYDDDDATQMMGSSDRAVQTTAAAASGSTAVGNGAMGEQDNDGTPAAVAASSPLTEFFAHLTNDNGNECESLAQIACANESSMSKPKSLKDWKEARKNILRDYITRRLIGADDNDESREEGVEEEEHVGDACSFSSEVLDDSFESSQTNAATDFATANNNDNDYGDEEDDDDTQQLETQPQHGLQSQSQSPLKTQQDDLMELEEMQPETQEEIISPAQKSFVGIKRKLGYGNASTQIGEEEADARNKRPRTTDPNRQNNKNNVQSRRRKKGLMWDGRLESIPHFESTSYECCKLDELDFFAKALNLSLCRVLRVWDMRSTKRMDKLEKHRVSSQNNNVDEGADDDYSSTEEPLDASCAMRNFEFYEDDGPLNTFYKRVFSVELAQFDDTDDGTEQEEGKLPSISPSVTNIATSAFIDGKHHLDKSTSRKRRHSVRRVRVYFYNAYADAMSKAFQDIQKSKKKAKKKADANEILLMSLANVPAECILPHMIASNNGNPNLQQYINNPFGDDDFGASSPYCVCIGDKSTIKFSTNDMERKPVYFDDEFVEIRLADAPSSSAGVNDDVNGGGAVAGLDAVINVSSIGEVLEGGDGYSIMQGEKSLVKRFLQMGNRRSITPQPVALFHPEKEDTSHNNNANATAAAAANQRNAVHRETNTAEANVNSQTVVAASRSPAGESAATGPLEIIERPRSVVPMCNLLPLLQQNGMKRLRDPITAYGVVLGFSPPSLTRTKEWTMSIVMIDDTLPLSTPQIKSAAVNNQNSPKELLHVPSVTLVLFAKDKSKLPVVRSAGDVVCCEKVVLQSWSGEPQLCGRKTSNIVLLRPKRARLPDAGVLHNSTDPNDWREKDGKIHTDNLHWPVVNSLWRWGQHRLAAHPTISPNCRLSIEKLEVDHQHNNNGNGQRNSFEASISGDFTAAVTAIIAMPEDLRHRATPRGYLRLWDGTGASRSDPLPPSVANRDGGQPHCDDPPQQVLIEIDKILRDISSPNSCTQACGSNDDQIQAPIALCGKVANAIIWEENLWNLIQNKNIVHLGSFVRLRNVNSVKMPGIDGTNCLSIHAKSSLTPLPHDAYEVKQLLKDHHSRLKRGVRLNPTSAILPNNTATTNTGGTTTSNAPSKDNENNNNHNSSIENANHNQLQTPMNNGGLSTIEQCLRKVPPASATVQFEVSHTIPACNPTNGSNLQALFTSKKKIKGGKTTSSGSFRFALHIKDATSEIDVLCLGEAASKMLGGVTVQDIVDKNHGKRREAAWTLREMMLPGSICEGKIKSVLGKDGKLYFILKSMFCITAEGEDV